jgi:pimeloyl-ACP methyl ester carboxylesterase
MLVISIAFLLILAASLCFAQPTQNIAANAGGIAAPVTNPDQLDAAAGRTRSVAGATAHADDVPRAEIHILDAGHFALDEATDEIALLVRDFLERLDHQGG